MLASYQEEENVYEFKKRATELYNNYKNYRDNVKSADSQYNIIKG